eukprot:CAMPEP_0171162216 /NCGR_PEP_ID=MMETSP0790-20130122/4474_1 /TAXON_ID=2925 /ORGANISM="Alexandrium catenella, Strain OF101" /LENGTH=74 /DNA_ID=CAMNT_0011626805 /DNA_START=37 /DNA_END=259 /DNA_ORIENTATION=-
MTLRGLKRGGVASRHGGAAQLYVLLAEDEPTTSRAIEELWGLTASRLRPFLAKRLPSPPVAQNTATTLASSPAT